MKKRIFSLILAGMMLLGVFSVVSASNSTKTLAEEKFESTDGATSLNYFNGKNNWAWNYGPNHASTTQTSRATITFETADGNTVMQSEGIRAKYNNTNDIWGNSSYKDTTSEYSLSERFLRLGFSDLFNAANYPNSSLVVSYDLTITSQDPTNILNGEQFIAALIPAADGSKAAAQAAHNLTIYQGNMFVGYSAFKDRQAINDDNGAKTEFKNSLGIKNIEKATETAATKMQIKMIVTPGVGEKLYVNDKLALATTNGVTDVKGIAFVFAGTVNVQLDNIKACTIANTVLVSSTPANGATGVKIDKDVTLKMSNSIDPASLADNITVSPAADFTASVDASDATKILIDFAEKLPFGTTYTITLTGVTDTNGTAASGSISFTTESRPAVDILNVTYSTGYGDSYAIVDRANLTAGGLLTAALTLENTTAADKDATIILAIYDADKRLVKCQYIHKVLAAGTTAKISNGIKLDGSLTGGSIKVFSWDSPSSIRPYQKNITETIK